SGLTAEAAFARKASAEKRFDTEFYFASIVPSGTVKPEMKFIVKGYEVVIVEKGSNVVKEIVSPSGLTARAAFARKASAEKRFGTEFYFASLVPSGTFKPGMKFSLRE